MLSSVVFLGNLELAGILHRQLVYCDSVGIILAFNEAAPRFARLLLRAPGKPAHTRKNKCRHQSKYFGYTKSCPQALHSALLSKHDRSIIRHPNQLGQPSFSRKKAMISSIISGGQPALQTRKNGMANESPPRRSISQIPATSLGIDPPFRINTTPPFPKKERKPLSVGSTN